MSLSTHGGPVVTSAEGALFADMQIAIAFAKGIGIANPSGKGR